MCSPGLILLIIIPTALSDGELAQTMAQAARGEAAKVAVQTGPRMTRAGAGSGYFRCRPGRAVVKK